MQRDETAPIVLEEPFRRTGNTLVRVKDWRFVLFHILKIN